MKFQTFCKSLLAFFLILLSVVGYADDSSIAETTKVAYITDVHYFPLRSGPGSTYRIIDPSIKTGSKVDIITQDAGNGYTQIKTDEGETGYILTRYLIFQPTASEQLLQAKERYNKLVLQAQNLTDQLLVSDKTINNLHQQLQQTNNQLNEKINLINNNQQICSSAVQLKTDNDQLTIKNKQLSNTLKTTEQENQLLKYRLKQRWFIYGGATLLIGIVLGIILPLLGSSLRRKRKKWI